MSFLHQSQVEWTKVISMNKQQSNTIWIFMGYDSPFLDLSWVCNQHIVQALRFSYSPDLEAIYSKDTVKF